MPKTRTPRAPLPAATLTDAEVKDLARSVANGARLNFTNLSNRNLVAKQCKADNTPTTVSTSRNQLYDPRNTVEGRHIPDRGLANDYKHFHSRLYSLEASRHWY